MRILILNDSLNESALSDFTVERLDGAFTARKDLWVDHAPNLHDFDAVIMDLARIEEREHGAGTPLGEQLQELVSGGGLILCFAAHGQCTWLPPGSFRPRHRMNGQRLKLVDHPLLGDFLKSIVQEMSYECDFESPERGAWIAIATTMAGSPVAGTAASDHVIVLPRVRHRERVVAALFKQVVPQIMPDRITARELLTEEPPSWIGEFPVPGIDKLDQEIADIEEKLSALNEEKERKAEERARLSEFQGLLWLKGKDFLEPIVQRALELLGVPCQKEEPRDLVYRCEGGPLYIEIEGSDSTIDVDKGRQLLNYIADSEDDPASIKCAIIANPFRKHHPGQRPPIANRPLFSPQLERLAQKQGWPLITAVELFELVRRHLEGDREAQKELRNRLGLK